MSSDDEAPWDDEELSTDKSPHATLKLQLNLATSQESSERDRQFKLKTQEARHSVTLPEFEDDDDDWIQNHL
jgi:hypothetical protein